MPKYKPITARLKAKKLTKSYITSGLNQSAVARKKGVTRQTINDQIHKKPVRDMLERYLDSNKLKKKLRQVAMEGLEANKVIGYIHQYKKDGDGEIEKIGPDEAVSNDFIDNTPDHNIRHKFWRDIMTIKGHIKNNGNGNSKGVSIINIIYDHRTDNTHSPIRPAAGRGRMAAEPDSN